MPWAMAFLPGIATIALVTEKPGRIWLVDIATGAQAAGRRRSAGGLSSQGGLLDVVLSPTFATDKLVYLTYSEPSANGGSGLALARARAGRDGAAPRLDGLQVIWRDPAGGQGGQFGASIAFAPDGQSLFLSSGERQRFTPAQDPSQPLGKILHLTLDGKPAPGNPLAGRTGAPTVTSPTRPKTRKRRRMRRHASSPGRARTSRLPRPGAPAIAIRSASPSRRTAGCGRPRWARAAATSSTSSCPAATTAGRWFPNGEQLRRRADPRPRARPRFRAAQALLEAVDRPAGLLIYTGDLFPQWKGDALIGALSGKALIHVRISGDQATKAEQWDMGHRIRFVGQGPDGEVYLLEDGAGRPPAQADSREVPANSRASAW